MPTISDADRNSVFEIAAARARLVGRARDGTVGLDDLRDGTFTVSNLGMFGVRRFEAVINPPQAAILAVGEVARRPWSPTTERSSPSGDGRSALVRPPCRLRCRGRAVPADVEVVPRAPGRPGSRLMGESMEIEFREAIRSALDEELERDESVIFFGEDVAVAGGVFAVTPGLWEKYGSDRVFDTPISELAMTGAAFGAAVTGKRPVLEIMFGDFLALSMDT